MDNNKSFLGTGWGFPPTFTKADRGTRMVSQEEDICESLNILLSTRPGERVMQPNYGCNLDVLLFEPMNSSMIAYAKDLITKSILYHEARIDLNTIDIVNDQQLEGLLLIKLAYTIRSTNSRFNYVYPFYINEAEVIEQNFLQNIQPVLPQNFR